MIAQIKQEKDYIYCNYANVLDVGKCGTNPPCASTATSPNCKQVRSVFNSRLLPQPQYQFCHSHILAYVVEAHDFDTDVEAHDIETHDVEAHDFKAHDVEAHDVEAYDVEAFVVEAHNVKACDVEAFVVEAHNVQACDIEAYVVEAHEVEALVTK